MNRQIVFVNFPNIFEPKIIQFSAYVIWCAGINRKTDRQLSIRTSVVCVYIGLLCIVENKNRRNFRSVLSSSLIRFKSNQSEV